MNRLRKKSDTKRSQYPILSPLQTSIPPPSASENPQLLPELPSEDDFLILPDLTRRFSLLRYSSGEPLPVDLLRSRLAEQRARGVENHISEEEEDMILESLGLRTKYATSTDKSENTMRQSTRSSLTHSPSSGRSAKRYSNNLFGSGRLRDYSYVRSATSPSKHASSRVTSAAPSEVSTSASSTFGPSNDFGSGTPENDALNSEQLVRSAPLIPPSPYGEHGALASAEYRLSKSLGPSAFKRASLALHEAIRELEEDAEDEVVMPRSAPITRAHIESRSTENPNTQPPDVFSAGMAISSDHQPQTETEERMSPIPSHILPGYIPGMPRPMTPREDMDNDILRSHSITPRAAATTGPNGPNLFSSNMPSPPTPPPIVEHVGPSSSSTFPSRPSRPLSPPFLQRSPVDPTQRGERGVELIDFDSSAVPGRKRPASPLSGPSYQPFTATAVTISRPSTPSNVTWTIPASKTSPQKNGSHNRSGSWFSDAEGSTDPHGTNGHSKSASASRSLRSPALPDSPILERSHPGTAYFGGTYAYENRPSSTISGIDLNSSSTSNRPIRSPTPTQSPARSPTSPTFSGMDGSPKQSRRSSKQNGTSIPFTLTPYNPVMFSPLANSSRSSLESTGSSYHSWEAENKFLFVDADSQVPPWHDLSLSSQSSSTTPAGSPDTEWNPEDVITTYAGLHKSDFTAIQDTLVSAVASKNTATSETRERVPSLRRRRPSTSQSNYSLNYRITTPPPPQSQPMEGALAMNSDQISKASALLNSVLDSINTQHNDVSRDSSTNSTNAPTVLQDVSPTTRRNRDLAQILFGEDTHEETPPTGVQSPAHDSFKTNTTKEKEPITTSPLNIPISSLDTSTTGLSSPQSALYNPLRSPSTPHIPQTPEAQAELAREIQRKTDAAMLALRKRPSNSNLSKEGLVSPGTVRKKFNTNQISTPTLLSASTSVDTIPLRTPPFPSAISSGPPSKIASRFRKLRGTLRKGNIPIDEIKVTPYPLDVQSNPSPHSSQPQFARYDSSKLHPMDAAVSATEIGRFRVPAVPVPSPPASAGPGLKGFMARFRGKARTTDSVEYKGQQLRPSPYQMSAVQTPLSFSSFPLTEEVKSAGDQFSHPSQSSSLQTPLTPQLQTPHSDDPADGVNQYESQALKQLFNAASDLGLDQGKLSELLVRSGSISSKSTDWTMLTRNNSSAARSRQESRDERQFQSPTPQSEWSTFEDPGHRASKLPVSRKSSMKQNENVGIRRPRQRGPDDTNTVIRRTIIYPEDRGVSVADLNALGRKNSSRRRRASAISATSSNRSIHERVPTPPPPRSPTGRRFSADESPPVPQLPQSWAARMDKGLAVPAAGGQSNTPYDSVYDMYTGEKSSQSAPAEATTSSDPGPALEVIELANGETIWSIVNGLRDDDVESLYAGRTSFQSDYDNDEGVQVFVKDHTRTGSKGSSSSYLSRRKIVQGKNRPETKVYYTSSAQIGRLIENLSQGMDAGTFNFSQEYSHSATSSMTGHTGSDYLTVEERLEHMLGAMKTA
ncbi:hypothetical protein J3R30DRAFT_882868 [Lentinula aciculospora]|uniref:Uncharacterized protein n=1 Tax=Lentinula aciculospora TaxID=153920 RepID=A0A9W9DW41_9AGAR|nr:hypothetical protein J3R30DRAFT_882868 [Lentinula aciculospora]